MIFIDNEGNNDPRLNLALEEYAVRNFDPNENFLLFYINEPSIIIGKNQNLLEEVNHDYVKKNGIHVVRRISGGGAVYHDLGNLNYSFLTPHDGSVLNNFKKFTDPVIKVLANLGIHAELKGRNDLEIDGRKISGTAQFSTGKKMFSHGTLMLNSDLDEVTRALQVKMSKIQSKGHKSIRSRVANISEYLKEPLDILEFRRLILEGLFGEDEHFETYHLTPQEWQAVHELKDNKYATWEWNYGRSPNFNIQRAKRFEGVGEIDVRIFVEKGHISELTIYGDFFGSKPVEEIVQLLQGVRYEPEDIKDALSNIDIKKYFGTITLDDFVQLLYGEDE